MIVTDDLGLIGQHRPDEPNNPEYPDFYDSCMRTSIAVICGISDASIVHFLDNKFRCVRHPKYSHTLTSRDQIIPLIAAFKLSNRYCSELYCRTILMNYNLFINKDFLGMPDIQWFFRKCKGDNSYSWLGDKALRASIWYASKIKPNHELNQAILVAFICGRKYLKLLCSSHPDWRKNLRDYYGTETSFRFQPELGESYVRWVEKRIND
jgi:hypothetical protein